MTVNVEQFNSAGFESLYWAVNDANGYPKGAAGVLANGADASMGRLLGVNRMALQPGRPRQVNVPGDDGVQAVYFFQPAELPSGDLVCGVFDVNFVAKSQNMLVYADGDFDVVILNPDSPTYKNMTLLTNSQGKSAASGSVGNEGFQVKILPRVQVVPMGDAGIENARDTSYTHALIASKSDKLPWGASITLANHGTVAGAQMGPFFSENRVLLHTFVADGTAVTFTLAELPAAANGNKVKAWKNGVLQAYTTNYTVNASTKVLTLAAAGSAGDIWVVRYEFVKAA